MNPVRPACPTISKMNKLVEIVEVGQGIQADTYDRFVGGVIEACGVIAELAKDTEAVGSRRPGHSRKADLCRVAVGEVSCPWHHYSWVVVQDVTRQ